MAKLILDNDWKCVYEPKTGCFIVSTIMRLFFSTLLWHRVHPEAA